MVFFLIVSTLLYCKSCVQAELSALLVNPFHGSIWQMEHSANLLRHTALCRVNQTVTTVAQLSDFSVFCSEHKCNTVDIITLF